MRKRITLLAVLLLLLSACQSQTEEATETTPPETEAPAVTESGETGDASSSYEFSIDQYELQMMGLFPMEATPALDDPVSEEDAEALKKAYTDKAKAVGADAALAIQPEESYRTVFKQAQEGIRGIYAEHEAGGKGAFYKVENNGNTAYLFGSIHIGEAAMYPIEAARMNAFEQADELWVELDLTDPQIMAELTLFQLRDDGKTLEEDIGTERLDRFVRIMEDSGIPVIKDNLQQIKSWTILNQLDVLPVLNENPYSVMQGVDQYFMNLANATDKPIHSVETVEIQMSTIEELYAPDPERLLTDIDEALDRVSSEEERQKSIEELQTMRRAWTTGDLDALMQVATEDADEQMQILTQKRDALMADKLAELLESPDKKTVFVMVGAAHYVPDDSVIGYLRDMGYTVEELQN
ncbi:MAG: TraB/GumN family protein [Tissierellia bacterium]|jgi:uncharacterized protein YbaP (TraB family)|nr:TraB/GumN family protein [Bacillota bacterium]NLK58326.1 TraB/GumN family protein [Tissierellia bacterium]